MSSGEGEALVTLCVNEQWIKIKINPICDTIRALMLIISIVVFKCFNRVRATMMQISDNDKMAH